MSKSTISTFELFQMFPDAEAARVYMEGKRWPDGAVCPACDEAKRITTRKGGFYRCNACKTDFTVRTATIFERSHIPLHKWLYAMYLLVTSRKGISSMQLAKQIGVTQKSAWFMLQRLREACGNELRSRYLRTLTDRPWKQCSCPICKALSVEVIIFRGSNRNKRRGIHNMGVFHTHVAGIEGSRFVDEDLDLFSSAGKPEPEAQGTDVRRKGVGRHEVRRHRPDRS